MSVAPLHFAIREATADDDAAIVMLWTDCGLTTAWNPPGAEIDRLRASGHGVLLVGCGTEGDIVATVMVGHDGHRGWIYFLAVREDRRHRGHGKQMVQAAEDWVAARGLVKCQLMVRSTSREVEAFYRKLGYRMSPVNVLQRWLEKPPVTDQGGTREVTTTFLEMRQRPNRQIVPVPSTPHAILRLHEPDTAFYRFMHDTIGRPWLWYERRLLDDEALRAIIHDPAVEVFVLYVRGNPAGFVEIDRRGGHAADLRFLGLLPDHTGRGLGRYLLAWAVEQAWQGATERVTVNTCTFDHPRALPLYQRAGFQPVRRETAVIDDPELQIRRLELARTDEFA